MAEHESVDDPFLQRVQREILAGHGVGVGGVQQLRRVGDQRQLKAGDVIY